MKTRVPLLSSQRCFVLLTFLFTSALTFLATSGQAGLTFEVRLIRDSQGDSYSFYTPIETNATAPAAPFGTYLIRSPQQPANGTWRMFDLTAGGVSNESGGSSSYNNFASVMNQITNGTWTITVTNSSTTNNYAFTVSAPNMNSNLLPATSVTFPANGTSGVTNRPNFTWQGPASWGVNIDAFTFIEGNFNQYANLPAAQTSWTPPTPLSSGANRSFYVRYITNYTSALFVATTPLHTVSSQPIAGWISRSGLESASWVDFSVAAAAGGSTTLFGHYTFDDQFNLTEDSSGQGNNAVNLFYPGGGSQMPQYNSAGISGGAIEFDGFNAMWWEEDMVNVLRGSYTISLWVETTQSYGNDDDDARDGATIFAGDDFSGDFPVPLALTGDKVGFYTAAPSHTINSGDSINSGDFTHIVVTRDVATGTKRIYINGVLDTTGTGGTSEGIDSQEVYLGYSYYSDQGIEGLVDDLQVYTGVLDATQIAFLYDNPGEVADTGGPVTGHTLKARYSFENGNIFASDVSGNGNNVTSIASSGGGARYTTNNPAIGNYSAYFRTNGASSGGWLIPTNALLDTVADSFTLSLWVQTTRISGSDTDSGLSGNAGLVDAFSGPGGTWIVPMSIVGNKLAFATGGSPQHTLRSTVAITNGSQFVHLAVSRDRTTGVKKIYVNGVLNASGTGSTDLLNTPTGMRIGYNNGTGLQGALDEIQFYEGVLSDAEISFLYNNPTSTVPDDNGGGGGGQLAEAVDAPQFTWSTGGDVPWFDQTSTTHDSTDAAQSGAIGDDQNSWIETTITGPGTLSFWWRVDSEDQFNYDYLEFSIQGNNWSEISGDYGWEYYEVQLESGPQTVRWTYWKDSDDSTGADAAWLDEVNFVPDVGPTITFQPIDQVNYSGYPVTLVADATAQPEAEWQWYKVGSGLIAGANSRFYTITNSGTPGVAGNYYALAYNTVSGVFTRTAAVTYVSAPLPPDWSKAFENQLSGDFDEPRTNYGIATLVDASGNIYSASSFTGANTFNSTNTFTAGPGRFASGLFKYTPNGEGIWGRAITNNGNGNSYPQCVAKAPGDGVYLSGVFLGTNQIGTNILQSPLDTSWVYLARFDSAGNVLWVRTFGGTNSIFQSYHQLVADPDGNVTISALGNNFVNFGSTNVTLAGQKGILAQYDANGTLRWISQPSGWVQYMAYNAGRIYPIFPNADTNYIGGLTNISDRKFLLAALNATNGQALWLQGIGSEKSEGSPSFVSDDIPAVCVSGADVFVSGKAWGSGATFGAVNVSWSAPNGQYLARYNTNGTAQLATTFGGTNTWPWAAVADAAGNVYVTGDFDGYATFGNKVISGPRLGGIGDPFRGQMFLAKFDRNGNSLWVRQAQAEEPSSFVNVRDLALASDGVWACGFVNYYANFGTNAANRVYGPVTIIGSPFGFIHYWVGGYLAKVSEAGVVTPPLAVTLANPQTNPTHLQFQFQSQPGFTHAVQYRTNLVTGQNWQTYSNVTGDGGVKIIGVPQSLFSPAQQGFIRISTQ